MRLRALVVLLLCSVSGTASLHADEAEVEPKITKAPKLLTFVEADYPPAQKAAGTEAVVTLTIEIGEDGKVANVQVAATAGPEFDAAAVAAARRFVFSPAELDGKPGPVAITYRYEFKIKTEVVQLGPQVNFEGTIRERFSKRIMRGVKVTVRDVPPVEAITDDVGHFEFVGLSLGRHVVEVSGPTLVTVKTEETLVKDQKKTVKYFVEEKQEGIDEERVARAPRIKKESVETTIRSEEARRVPGTSGDTLKVVQNLPGVARSSAGSGALVVWGAAPNETKVNIDGVEIPALYHVGGFRSTVNSELVRSIELVPGGFGADYGRGIGGLVKVETKPMTQKGVHGVVQVDVIDSSAYLTAAITPQLHIGIAGRYSYLDEVVRGVTQNNNKDASLGLKGPGGDATDFIPIPRYYDYQVTLGYQLARDEALELFLLASNDKLQRNVPSVDPSNVKRETTEQTFYRVFLRYSKLNSDGSSLTITPSFGWDQASTVQQFGLVPTTLSSTGYRYGLRAAYRRKLARFATLSTGLDLSGQLQDTARFGSINRPAREGDIFVFGQAPGDDVNFDSWSTHIVDAAPYAFVEFKAHKTLTITPGVRFDGYYLEGSRLVPQSGQLPPVGYSRFLYAVDPRLQLSYRPHPRLGITAAVGLFHQAPEAQDLSAVFGNPKLGLSQAVHVSLAFDVKLTGTLNLQAVGFYKDLSDLPIRNVLSTPPLAQALTQDAVGRVYGGQVMLRQELWKGFFGWVTYSVSRSERRNHPGEAYRLFDFDQTHSLTLVASYEYRHWIFGTRFRWSSGFPRTPVVAAYYDPRGDQYQPIFGAQNSIRVPDFLQLDLRIDRSFTFRRASLDIYLDVQNITARANPEEIVYNFDFSRRGYISGLPVLAVLGAKVQW